MEIVLIGSVPSKKNSKQIVCRGSRPILLPSKAHKEWHEEQMLLLAPKRPRKPIERCDVEVVFYMKDRRVRDLSNAWETIADLLVDAGYIKDDNYTVLPDIHLMFGGVNKENPRAVIRLFC